MKSPVTGKEMILAKERRTLSFRKEDFEVVYHSYKCMDSGESFTTEQLDELNLNQLYNQYRVKLNLPFPDKIKSIREKYDISRKVESIIQEQNQYKQKLEIENYLIGQKAVNSNTGYRQPDLAKFSEMVVFFTEKLQPWKTKLNKLLFYADFGMFRNTIYSISGIQYQAISMGPVPYNFQSIFEYLANNDDVDVYFTTFPNGNVGEQFKSNKNRKFNSGLFNELELKILYEAGPVILVHK